MNRIAAAFDEIKAEDKLKRDTMQYLSRKTNQNKHAYPRRLIVSLACFGAVMLAGLFSYMFYFSGVSYVDIDVNPSIELKLNRFNRVIGMSAYDDEGLYVLSNVSIRNMANDKALAVIIDEMAAQGYIKDAALVSATFSTNNTDNALQAEIQSSIDAALKAHSSEIAQNVFEVDALTKTASHDLRLTPAKYLAISELQEVDPSVSYDECRGHSISEINEMIDQCKGGHSGGGHHQPSEGHHGGCAMGETG